MHSKMLGEFNARNVCLELWPWWSHREGSGRETEE